LGTFVRLSASETLADSGMAGSGQAVRESRHRVGQELRLLSTQRRRYAECSRDLMAISVEGDRLDATARACRVRGGGRADAICWTDATVRERWRSLTSMLHKLSLTPLRLEAALHLKAEVASGRAHSIYSANERLSER
jgi:hypothetical protein